MSLVGGLGLGASFGSVFLLVVYLAFCVDLGLPCFRLARAPEVVGFVGASVVFFLLMVWVELGSLAVVFGWVISVAIVLRVRRVLLGRRGSYKVFQIFQTIAHFFRSAKLTSVFDTQRSSSTWSNLMMILKCNADLPKRVNESNTWAKVRIGDST